MKEETFLIIINPAAAGGRAVKRIGPAEALFHKKQLKYSLVFTRSPGHGVTLAEEAVLDKRADIIVAAGGDGTVNEVINGIMQALEKGGTPPDFGVLPIGRGNDFAFGAGVPSSVEEAVDVLANGRGYPLDTGRIRGGLYPEGRFFGNGIGVGFDTIVGLEAAKANRIPGALGYVYGALKTFLLFPKAPAVKMSWGDSHFEGESHQISIMNGKRMGGTFFMAPDGLNDDGLFDLCMARQSLTRGDMLRGIFQYTRGTQAKNPLFKIDRGARFLIEAPEGGLVCHADGETICTDGTSLDVECIPGALTFRGDKTGELSSK
ncbi:MAG: diacylglycerol/lipid kinase family protein [Spirochaetaceae bacterium]